MLSRSFDRDEPAYYRDDLRCKQFNRLCDFDVWEAADVNLGEKSIMSEEPMLIHKLVDYLLGVPNKDRRVALARCS